MHWASIYAYLYHFNRGYACLFRKMTLKHVCDTVMLNPNVSRCTNIPCCFPPFNEAVVLLKNVHLAKHAMSLVAFRFDVIDKILNPFRRIVFPRIIVVGS